MTMKMLLTMENKSYIRTYKSFYMLIKEGVDQDLVNIINSKRDHFLSKVIRDRNFCLFKGYEITYSPGFGEANKCETNVYKFIKKAMEHGEDWYYPVGGFMFDHESYTPCEHWWVYDSKKDEHIEVTPLVERITIQAYGGVIEKNINYDILKSNSVWDIDFFKGGNVYFWHFKDIIRETEDHVLSPEAKAAMKLIDKYIDVAKKADVQINEYVPNSHIMKTFEYVKVGIELEDRFKEKYKRAGVEFLKFVPDVFNLATLNKDGIKEVHTAYQKLREKEDPIRNSLKLQDIRCDFMMPLKVELMRKYEKKYKK